MEASQPAKPGQNLAWRGVLDEVFKKNHYSHARCSSRSFVSIARSPTICELAFLLLYILLAPCNWAAHPICHFAKTAARTRASAVLVSCHHGTTIPLYYTVAVFYFYTYQRKKHSQIRPRSSASILLPLLSIRQQGLHCVASRRAWRGNGMPGPNHATRQIALASLFFFSFCEQRRENRMIRSRSSLRELITEPEKV